MKRCPTPEAQRRILSTSTSKKSREKVRSPSRRILPKRCSTYDMKTDRACSGSMPSVLTKGIYPNVGNKLFEWPVSIPGESSVIWLGPERENALALRELDALGSRIEVDWALRLVAPLSGDGYDQWLNEPLPF